MRIIAILLLLVSFSSPVLSSEEGTKSLFSSPVLSSEEGTKSLQELQTEEFLLEGTFFERIVREARRKAIQCMLAFPHEEFCTCLGNELPFVVKMTQYVLAVTVSKEELGYDQLSEEQRKAVDVIIQARETCAARINR